MNTKDTKIDEGHRTNKISLAGKDKKIARTAMRGYARIYRENLKFARRYYEYNQPVYEKWCVKAGQALELAEIQRDISLGKNRFCSTY